MTNVTNSKNGKMMIYLLIAALSFGGVSTGLGGQSMLNSSSNDIQVHSLVIQVQELKSQIQALQHSLDREIDEVKDFREDIDDIRIRMREQEIQNAMLKQLVEDLQEQLDDMQK